MNAKHIIMGRLHTLTRSTRGSDETPEKAQPPTTDDAKMLAGTERRPLPSDPADLIAEISPYRLRANKLRYGEYAYLDHQGHVYLDYTGAGLPSRSQIQAQAARLVAHTSGNPHSINPTSQVANTLIARTRARILAFLHADPDEYAVIFTANATGAARLVGESYAFDRHSRLVLTADNHNSLNGLRCFAERARAQTVYVPVQRGDLRTSTEDVAAALKPPNMWSSLRGGTAPRSLFAYPAQSNFTGVIHPLSWVDMAQQRGYDVLLDAAAYLPTSDLDLGQVKPAFVIVSWYKLFGFPTGVGCLIARRDALARLRRPWFSGGTVDAVSVSIPWHGLASDEAAFEDGTVNFLSIPDVEVGIDWICHAGRAETASRVLVLTRILLYVLEGLRHPNGRPMAVIYGPTSGEGRGGTVAFNLLDVHGGVIDSELLAVDAAAAHISLRTGCFCNPGAGEAALGLDPRRIQAYIRERAEAGRPEPLGSAVRVSFGIASNHQDLEALVQLIHTKYRGWDPNHSRRWALEGKPDPAH